MHVFLFCFFFQAEDGIRDGRVTGVQTCALPIWLGGLEHVRRHLQVQVGERGERGELVGHAVREVGKRAVVERERDLRQRSEERRVGKSVDLGGRRIIKKKKKNNKSNKESRNKIK